MSDEIEIIRSSDVRGRIWKHGGSYSVYYRGNQIKVEKTFDNPKGFKGIATGWSVEAFITRIQELSEGLEDIVIIPGRSTNSLYGWRNMTDEEIALRQNYREAVAAKKEADEKRWQEQRRQSFFEMKAKLEEEGII